MSLNFLKGEFIMKVWVVQAHNYFEKRCGVRVVGSKEDARAALDDLRVPESYNIRDWAEYIEDKEDCMRLIRCDLIGEFIDETAVAVECEVESNVSAKSKSAQV